MNLATIYRILCKNKRAGEGFFRALPALFNRQDPLSCRMGVTAFLEEPIVTTSPINANQSDCETMPVRYLNHYRCPYCQQDWQDEWDCACNDRCPSCDKEIVPYHSDLVDLNPEEICARSDQTPLPMAEAQATKKKFVVAYEIDYVHRVVVGIAALNETEARQLAEQAFNDATIWDDTEAMPLLSDDYYESGDESLIWECEMVENYPAPDYSVRQLHKEQAAIKVCRGLVEAYQQEEAAGGSIRWEDLDQWLPWAMKALDS